jgi:antitoxin of RelE/RelB toxin-antitoxin system
VYPTEKGGAVAAHHFAFSEARSKLKHVYDDVERGNVAVIERRGSKPAVVWDRDDLAALLAERFPMDPQVSFDDGSVAMWLPNLPVHAEGASFDEAAEVLIDALGDYAELWEDQLRHAPNHKAKRGWILQVQLCGNDRDQIRRLLFDA